MLIVFIIYHLIQINGMVSKVLIMWTLCYLKIYLKCYSLYDPKDIGVKSESHFFGTSSKHTHTNEYILTYIPVAKCLVCKQRPLPSNDCNIHTHNKRAVLSVWSVARLHEHLSEVKWSSRLVSKWDLLMFSPCELSSLVVGIWGTGIVQEPEYGECPPLKVATRQRLVKTQRTGKF